MRQAWPAVLARVQQTRRVTYMVLSQNATLIEARDGVLTLGFDNAGARDMYLGGNNPKILGEALAAVTGGQWRVNAIMSGPDSAATQRPAAASRAANPFPGTSATSRAADPSPARLTEPDVMALAIAGAAALRDAQGDVRRV